MAPFYGPDLARIHHLGFGELAREAGPFLIDQIRKVPQKGIVIDVGCGGGLLSRHLVDAGLEVTGYDLSPAMVELARRTVPEGTFEVAPAAEAPLSRAAAVLAIGEVLSYLPPGGPAGALDPFIRRAHRALPGGGLLAFDLLTEGRPLGSRTWVEGGGWAVLTEVEEPADAEVVVRRIVTFVAGEGGFRRGEETHLLRVDRTAAVVAALEREGFRVRTRRSWGRFRLPARRVAFLATKVG